MSDDMARLKAFFNCHPDHPAPPDLVAWAHAAAFAALSMSKRDFLHWQHKTSAAVYRRAQAKPDLPPKWGSWQSLGS